MPRCVEQGIFSAFDGAGPYFGRDNDNFTDAAGNARDIRVIVVTGGERGGGTNAVTIIGQLFDEP